MKDDGLSLTVLKKTSFMLLVIKIMRNAFDPVINKSTVLKIFIRNKIRSYDLLHAHLKLDINVYKYRLKN